MMNAAMVRAQLQETVHGLLARMFPFTDANGWAYKACSIEQDDGRAIVNLRFEKKIIGRGAFAVLHLFGETLSIHGYDLKGWILEKLEAEEAALMSRHHQECAGIA